MYTEVRPLGLNAQGSHASWKNVLEFFPRFSRIRKILEIEA